jgi:hypothetical protein
MARLNPDPYTGGHFFALANRVTCLLDTEDGVKAMVRALEDDGVAPDDIDVFTGLQGADCLDLHGRAHGITVRVLRQLEMSIGNEREINQRIHDALCQGSALLCVRIHKKKSGEKDRALKVLRDLHAHEIHYWGPWAFDDLVSS